MSPVASYALAGAAGQSTDTSYEIKKGLRFNSGDSAYMSRTPDTEGNRRTWTWSAWVKRSKIAGDNQPFLTANSSTGNSFFMGWHGYYSDGREDALEINNVAGVGDGYITSGVYRDTSAWYHVVVAFDSTQSTAGDRIQCFINGVQQTWQQTVNGPNQNDEWKVNDTIAHTIGDTANSFTGQGKLDSYLADVQFIDGSALLPTVFGEYDSNGVWQPKEVTEAALTTAKESQQPYNTRDNMAQEWSGGTISGSPYNANYAWSVIFNGDPLNNVGATSTGSGTNPYTIAIPSLSFSTLTLYTQSGNANGIWVNGNLIDCSGNTVYGSGLDSQTVGTITFTSSQLGFSTLTELGANGQNRWFGIAVDGRLLVDGPADDSQLWSATALRSDWGSLVPPENLFDGSLSTYTYASGSSYRQITWDAITASTSVEVYGRGTTDSWRMIIDGSPVSVVFSGNTVADNSWRTVSTSFPCSVTGIENNNPGAVYAVRIDGKILVDSPSQFNAGKTWSKYLTSPAGFNSGRYPDRAFVGTDSSDFAATPANVSGESNAIEFTPPTTIAYTTLEVRGRGTDQTTFSVKIDTGSGYGSAITSTGDKWQTIATSGTLTKLKLWTTSFAGENEFGGIRIDGKVLVDGGWGTNGFHLPFDDATDIGKDATATAPALDPRGGFDAVTYTGTGAYNQVSNLRFAPDLVWIKDRSAGNHHYLVDSVRGVGTSEALFPDRNVAAGDGTQRVSSLNSDGFSVFGTYGYTNTNGSNYAAWCWKAGGAAVSNTDGTVTSTVSADQNYGFSVVQFDVGTPSYTVGHGLGSEPKFMIFKSKSAGSTNWNVYHVSTGNQSRSYLNLTNAASSGEACWNSTSPTSSVFSMGSSGEFSGTMMAYCWSEIAGFSKMGSYSGSSNPVTVNTGFAPKFILIKSDDTAGQEWIIKDRARGFDKYLIPNNSDAEATGRNVTFNSDGFTVDSGQGPTNWSGRNYIYVAFADYPGNDFTPHNIITEENTSAKNNFGTVLYTGTGASQTITGLNFQPDLVWLKCRSDTFSHLVFDTVRGFSGTNALSLTTNSTNAESSPGSANQGLLSFNSNGFSLGPDSTSNNSEDSYVAWCWKANGGESSSNTNGTITSSVSANPNFGFSVVSYSGNGTAGATVGHGLNSPPALIISKSLNVTNGESGNWFVNHSYDYSNWLRLNLTNTGQSISGSGGGTIVEPTNSVFSTYAIDGSNIASNDYVAYCWSEVPGYSRFSSYVGNGSTTGPVIECGFKPAFILIKGATSATDWLIWDSARNLGYGALAANLTQGESWFGLTNTISVTDTGFQITTTNAVYNTSGATYIYAAFADPAYGDLDLVNDTPTANAADPVKGNYCTLNAVDENSCTFSNGNLGVTVGSNSNCRGTVWPSSGKWYFEFDITSYGNPYVGIASHGANLDSYTSDNSIAINNAGDLYVRTAGTLAYPGKSVQLNATGSYMCAFDLDNGKIWWGKDGTWYAYDASTANTTTTVGQVEAGNNAYDFSSHANFGKEWTVAIGTSSNSSAYTFNAGQQPFKYTPPSGYKRLCTTNLPDPLIEDGSTAFNAITYTGSSGTKTITTGFSPDFVWIKNRGQTRWHSLFDTVRGAYKRIFTNATNAEANDVNYNLNSFTSTGFTLLDTDRDTNSSDGDAYVAWAWDAGSSNTSIAAGSLNSSLYNQNSTWSSNWTASGNGFGGQPPSNAFDADFNNYINNNAGGQYITWDTTSYTLSGTLEINCSSSSGVYDVYVNGTKVADTPSSRGWVNCGSFADINEIQFGGSSYNSTTGLGLAGINIYEIKVAGKTLVDSGVSITTPSIASTVRANPSAGFSIVSYGNTSDGSTIGHSLSASPHLIISKNRDSSSDWNVYLDGFGASDVINLNNTDAKSTSGSNTFIKDVTSTTFTVGSSSLVSGSDDYIAYCFSPVSGYSAMGSYTGNGSSDGPFVYLGFRPAYILVKNSSIVDNWEIYDAARSTYNATDHALRADTSGAEYSHASNNRSFDILSNGFKVRGSSNGINGSGNTLIYAAFAEHPFKTSRAR